MAATTEQRSTPHLAEPEYKQVGTPAASAGAIYKGTMAMHIFASGTVEPAGTAAIVGKGFAAVIGAADDDRNAADVRPLGFDVGVRRWVNGDSITALHIGQPCFAADNQTIVLKATAAGVKPFAGTVDSVDALGVWVRHLPLGTLKMLSGSL